MNKFGIYAWPAYTNKTSNPYNYLIYKPIELQGYKVYDFYLNTKWKKQLLKKAISAKYKIFHIHWPSYNILKADSTAEVWERFLIFFVIIKLAKLYKKKIVWTVHNLENHENHHPRLQKYIDKLLYNHVDGFITMNKEGLEIIKKKIKPGRQQKISYIPHPYYKNYYPNEIKKEDARKNLKISNESFVFLFFGQIRKYKNVPALIEAFKKLNCTNAVLLIAGRVNKDMPALLLSELINGADNIKLYDTFINDDDIQLFMNAADLVVTPYNKVFNSGSVFLNLSFGKPTLAPDVAAIMELKESVGEKWIKTYEKDLSAEILENAMREVIQGTDKTAKPDLEMFNPDVIAAHTINFYKSLL